MTAPSIDALLARDEVLLLAHAGGNFDAPQETLYAYRRAVEAGSDALELDVMLTADDVLVVHHDDTVDRLTDGTGAIADMELIPLVLDRAHTEGVAVWIWPNEPSQETTSTTESSSTPASTA